jgi:hypothetical protein
LWRSPLVAVPLLVLAGLLFVLLVTSAPAHASQSSTPSRAVHEAGAEAAASCSAQQHARVIVAGCSWPTSTYCLTNGVGCITLPDFTQFPWYVWCVLSSTIYNAISSAVVSAVNNLGSSVFSTLTQIQNDINSIWNAIWAIPGQVVGIVLSFFGTLLASFNNFIATGFWNLGQTIVADIVLFFTTVDAALYSGFASLATYLAFAGPFAPAIAVTIFLAVAIAIVWLSYFAIRELIVVFRSVYNLL